MESFSDWLERELAARDMRPADLARLANIGDATLSRILNGSRNAGPDACLSIAQALKMPPEIIFRLAGLLPPAPAETEDREELLYTWERLLPGERQIVLRMLRSLAGMPQHAPRELSETDLRAILNRATVEQLVELSERLSLVIDAYYGPRREIHELIENTLEE
jgi:transcriptional regulator with XRE-family HTH domain